MTQPTLRRLGRVPALLTIAALIVAGVTIAVVRTSRMGGWVLPTSKGVGHRVLLEIRGEGDGRPVTVQAALPIGRDGQRLVQETFAGELAYEVRQQIGGEASPDRLVTWLGSPADAVRLRYELLVEGGVLGPVEVGELPVAERERYLTSTPRIPVGHEQLADRVARNKVEEIGSLIEDPLELAERLFTYVRFDVVASDRDGDRNGGQDALTTMRQEAGSPASQARLLTALLRTAGIPARMAAGIPLQSGAHDQLEWWTEVYLDGRWRPGDPYEGDTLGQLPSERLRLFMGEGPFLERSGLTDVRWSAEVARQFHGYFMGETPPSVSLFWLPHELHGTLRNILLIPLGLLIVVMLSVVLGLRVLDVLTPVLIGLVLVETTVPLGLALLAVAGGLGLLIGRVAKRFGGWALREGVVSMSVVGVLLFGLWGFDQLGLYRAYLPGLFAMAVIVLVAQRVLARSERSGWHEAVLALAGTVLVGALLTLLNQWTLLHQVLFTYPETIFWALGLALAAGRFAALDLLAGFYPGTDAAEQPTQPEKLMADG